MVDNERLLAKKGLKKFIIIIEQQMIAKKVKKIYKNLISNPKYEQHKKLLVIEEILSFGVLSFGQMH